MVVCDEAEDAIAEREHLKVQSGRRGTSTGNIA
jgi:hypothetical protein